jgi:hypothetical protein
MEDSGKFEAHWKEKLTSLKLSPDWELQNGFNGIKVRRS